MNSPFREPIVLAGRLEFSGVRSGSAGTLFKNLFTSFSRGNRCRQRVISHDGEIVDRFKPKVKPKSEEMIKSIETQLHKQ